MTLCRCTPPEHLIVQHGGGLVEGDDVVVRQFLLAKPAGADVRLLNLKLGRPGGKSARGGVVAERPEAACLAQAGELVVAFDGARKIQARQEPRRIDGGETPGA